MDRFLERVTPPEEEPQAAPSGGVPEDGTAITGDGSSMYVAAWDLPVGLNMESDVGDPGPCRPGLMCVCTSVFNQKV